MINLVKLNFCINFTGKFILKSVIFNVNEVMKYSRRIFDELNKLLEKNYDAEQGYIDAVNRLQSNRLKHFFTSIAEEKSTFAKELRTEILSYCKVSKEVFCLTGSVYRDWDSLKSLFISNNEEIIIEEVLKGEKESLKSYDDVISISEFTLSTLQILEKQRQQLYLSINSINFYEQKIS